MEHLNPVLNSLSLVVCTYNRASLLETALKSVLSSKDDFQNFELVVVNNNSTDQTISVAERVLKHAAFPYRIVTEMRSGIGAARNRGFIESHLSWIGYIDDDAMLSFDWIATAKNIIRNADTDLAMFGGPYYSYYSEPKPFWFPETYGSWVVGAAEKKLNSGQDYLCGTNIVIRRSLLLETGGFPEQYGHANGKRNFGEETALQIKLRKNNKKIIYYEKLKVKHLVRPELYNFNFLITDTIKTGIIAGVLSPKRAIFVSLVKIILTPFLEPFRLCSKLHFNPVAIAVETFRLWIKRLAFVQGWLSQLKKD